MSDISTKIGRRTFAVAVLETTSVIVAAMMLTIKLITQTGSPLKAIKYFTSQVENPEKHITAPLVEILSQMLLTTTENKTVFC